MKVSEKYFYPPRPELTVPYEDINIFTDRGWWAQYKFNDSRLVLKVGDRIEFWTRHGARYRTYDPHVELLEQIRELPFEKPYCLDGGLLHLKHPAIKHTIVIWDVLGLNDEFLVGSKYRDRYKLLLEHTTDDYYFKEFKFGLKLSDDIFVPENLNDCSRAWDVVNLVNQDYNSPLLEGLVFKDPDGVMSYGFKLKSNSDWLAKCRVETGRHRF